MSEVKQGELAIDVTLKRSTKGLILDVRVHEGVEEFMKLNASEETSPVDLIGRQWRRMGGDAPLEVYELPQAMYGVKVAATNVLYRLDQPGRGMVSTDQNSGVKVVNLSFIRLVGISGDEPVSIAVAGVHSDDECLWIASAIRDASRAFYNQYMKTLNIKIELMEALPTRDENIVAGLGGGEAGQFPF